MNTRASKIHSTGEQIGLLEKIQSGIPVLLIPALAVFGLLVIGTGNVWLTLTVAGLAMGMMIFTMASGLTLIFGLMDVINFAHGAFISVGAFIGVSVLVAAAVLVESNSLLLNLTGLFLGMLAAILATAILGWVFERFVVMPVYGKHLEQILVTMGGLIIIQQLIYVIWGPDEIHISRPVALQGSIYIGEAVIEKYRLFAVGLGLAIFALMHITLTKTKIGLLVRAGVENSEMVESLGYRIRRLFVLVFMTGSALAGLGGVMWGLYQETITAHMGSEVLILVFIVIIIGGLGSIGGCFIGALLVGLLANYAAFLVPKLALISNISLMVAILMWRPQGLYPVVKAK